MLDLRVSFSLALSFLLFFLSRSLSHMDVAHFIVLFIFIMIKDTDSTLPPKGALPTGSEGSSAADAARATKLERRMRGLRRNIVDQATFDLDNFTEDDANIFEVKVSTIKRYWEEFLAAWNQREEIQVSGKDDFPNDTWYEFYDLLEGETIRASGTLLSVKRRLDARRTRANPHQATFSGLNASTASFNKPQLPKIRIPTFSGDVLKWTHFRDTFLSMIHNEPSLSNIERFHYLIGALEGEAESLISSFPVEEQSYEQAWAKVVEAYDNPRILASLLIHKIVDHDTRSFKDEMQRYDAFLTGVADSIDAFRALRIEQASEFILATLALRALDYETRRHFELSLRPGREFPTSSDVLDFVRKRKSALNMSRGVRTNSSSLQSKHPNHGFKSSVKVHSVAFHSASQHNHQARAASPKIGNSRSPKCNHCQGQHLLSRCSGFSNLPASKRLELVRTWKVCWNCLRKGHNVSSCFSKFRCRQCNKRHHTLIHRDNGDSSKAKEDSKPATPTDSETFIGFGSTPAASITSNCMVLLGTVRTFIRDHRGAYHPARGLLDSGSQHTFLTTSLAKKLGTKIHPLTGRITSLGESTIPKSQLKGHIECNLRPCMGDQEYSLSAVVVDRITSALPKRNIPQSMVNRLKHHPLADPQFGKSGPIDILIGGDLYPKIITGIPFESGVDELFLQPTVFGHVASGTVRNFFPSSSISMFIQSEEDTEAQLKVVGEVQEPSPVDLAGTTDRPKLLPAAEGNAKTVPIQSLASNSVAMTSVSAKQKDHLPYDRTSRFSSNSHPDQNRCKINKARPKDKVWQSSFAPGTTHQFYRSYHTQGICRSTVEIHARPTTPFPERGIQRHTILPRSRLNSSPFLMNEGSSGWAAGTQSHRWTFRRIT